MSPLTVFLTTFNTNLQGSEASDQDLHTWLLPVLQNATIDEPHNHLPDIYAIAVQELLPLHLALAGLSRPVLVRLTSRIKAILSAQAKALTGASESFSLVSRVSHAGIALWIFARDSILGGRIGKVLTTSLGVGFQPLGMGNKGAVACRIFVDRGENHQQWESFTFVSAHLEAHDHNLQLRNANYQMLLKGLTFPATASLDRPTQLHETSHLFLMGDLNYRLAKLPKAGVYPTTGADHDPSKLLQERTAYVELDTLRSEQNAGRVFGGLREGDLRSFAPTYKRVNGAVQGYSHKRTPGYTDRILLASHNDPEHAHQSRADCSDLGSDFTAITHFNSTETITLSDHKPVHAVVRLPTGLHNSGSLHLAPVLPDPPQPHTQRPPPIDATKLMWLKLLGSAADRIVGWPWCLLHLLGGGDTQRGLVAAAVVCATWTLWHIGVSSKLFT